MTAPGNSTDVDDARLESVTRSGADVDLTEFKFHSIRVVKKNGTGSATTTSLLHVESPSLIAETIEPT